MTAAGKRRNYHGCPCALCSVPLILLFLVHHCPCLGLPPWLPYHCRCRDATVKVSRLQVWVHHGSFPVWERRWRWRRCFEVAPPTRLHHCTLLVLMLPLLGRRRHHQSAAGGQGLVRGGREELLLYWWTSKRKILWRTQCVMHHS